MIWRQSGCSPDYEASVYSASKFASKFNQQVFRKMNQGEDELEVNL
jgi:hypothetical protein